MPFLKCELSSLIAVISIAFVFALVGCAGYTEQRAGSSLETQEAATSDRTKRTASVVTEWSGTVDKSKLTGIGDPIVSNDLSWTQVWKTLHGTSEVPEVDFEKHLVYLYWTDSNDPNGRDVDIFVDAQQFLSVQVISTAIGYSSSDSLDVDIYLVDRKGISTW